MKITQSLIKQVSVFHCERHCQETQCIHSDLAACLASQTKLLISDGCFSSQEAAIALRSKVLHSREEE